MPRAASLAFALRAATFAVAGGLGCAAGDSPTGIGGVLVVSQVAIEGGNGVVLIGGTRQLQATPRTSTGIPVPGKTVTWASGNTARAQVNSAGMVTGISPGAVTISADVDGVTGQIDLDVRPVPVASVEVTAGSTTLEAGETMLLQAVARDSIGGVLPGRSMTWSSSNSSAATVSAAGLVTAVAAGTTTITATTDGRSGSVLLTITARPATRLGFVVQPSTTTAGLAISPPIRVAFQDAAGATVTTATGSVTLSLASSPPNAVLNGTLTAQAVQGVATFNDVIINRAGSGFSINAVATGFAPTTSAVFSVSGGPPAALAITTQPAGGSASGSPLTQQPVVQLRDALGNDARQAGVSISASLVSGPGTLTGTTSVLTNTEGRAAFTNLALVGSIGTYSIRFDASGLGSVTANPLSVAAGAPTQLTFTTAPPGTAVNGQPLGTSVVIQLRDGTGNPVTQSGTLITASILSGPGGVLGGTLTVATGPNGAATFSNLRVTGPVGQYTLQFSSPGLSPATANPLTLGPGAATALAVQVQPPASTSSGQVLAPQPSIGVVDQSGNTVTTSSLVVTAALASGPGTLGGTLSAAAASGVAAFTDLSISGGTGTYTIGFTATGVTGVTSNTISVGAGGATQLAFVTSPPAGATIGVPLSPQPVTELRDASNNPVASAGVNVTASLLSGPGTLTGTLTATTQANGRASFSDLAIIGLPGNYVIRFTSGSLPTLDSEPISVGIGPATQLLFDQSPPASATNGLPFGSSTVVRLADAGGNLVATSGVSILASIASGPGAVLGGTTTGQTVGGVATFDNLSLTGLVGGYVLDFTSGVLAKATTNSIQLQPGAPTKLVFATAPPASAANGESFDPPPVVQLQDASSNNVGLPGVTVTVSRVSGDASVNIGGDAAQTDATGRATFAALTLTGPSGNYVLAFLSTGLTGVTSSSIALSSQTAAAKLGFVTAPSSTAVNGAPLAQQPVVQLLDATDLPLAEAGLSITVSLSGGGTLTATSLTMVTDAAGQAAFSEVTITGLAGPRTLNFSATGLPTLTSESIDLLPGPASALMMVTQPPTTTTSGATLVPAPAVRLVDQSGNAVADLGINVSVALDPAATLNGTTTVATDASGIATFAGLSIAGGAAGTYALAFSATGLAGVQSSQITLLVPAGIEVTTQPSPNAVRNTVIPQQPAVTVTDGGGVGLSGVTVTVSVVTVSGPAASGLSGTLSQVTGAGGIASWTNLAINKPNSGAGEYRLRFSTADGLTVDSNIIAIP